MHGREHRLRVVGLTERGVRDGAAQLGELLRHRANLAQRLTGVVRQARPVDHFANRLFHRGDHFVGFRLDALGQGVDLLRRAGGALGQSFDFLCDDGEPAAGLTGHRGLNRCVQCKDRGAVGDVVDQLDNLADFLRPFAEALDSFRGLLHLVADAAHGLDVVLHGAGALFGVGERLLGDLRRGDGVLRDVLNRRGHRGDGARRVFDAGRLVGRVLDQLLRRRLNRDGGRRHLAGGRADLGDQAAQLDDHVVEGVGDGARHVGGDLGFGRQVAGADVGHFVQQLHDRLLQLVSFILRLDEGQGALEHVLERVAEPVAAALGLDGHGQVAGGDAVRRPWPCSRGSRPCRGTRRRTRRSSSAGSR